MPGKIKVKILAGRNLPVMDRSGDTTDAYVEIKFGNTTYKTDVCRKSLNPQWNSEWYRFEVDDAELQDEPLQVRLMDHDTYSANDAIGKVYVNLNPLLLPGLPPAVKNIWTLEATMNSSIGSQGGSVMTGWIPVFDTMHGIRGEVNIIVKVELFSDCNKFRQSSCGVQFFYSPNIPHGYHAQVIHGFVEELVVSDDPEYKWIDKIRTPRASNEARQTLFFKLSGEVQRKIGLKALDLGGNAVIGYVQNFDLEGESGIVARGIGTAVTLVKLQDISSILPIETSNIEDLTSFGLQPKNHYDLSESDDSLPLLSHSPNLTPLSRSPTNLHTTTVSHRFPKVDKPSKHHPRHTIRVSEYRAAGLRSRQFSLQHNSSAIGSNPMRKVAVSSLSLADDLISESSLKNMLALEDMRGEPTGNPFSRGLKNFRYLHQSILPRRVAQIKSKISDSFDDESDQDSTYSSTWSLAGSESNRSSSIADLRQSIRRKKFTHKKTVNDGIAALLIRSVHSGFPLDSVREDRETPTPSPVNFLADLKEYVEYSEDHMRSVGMKEIEEGNSNEESTSSQIDESYSENKSLLGKNKRDVKYTNELLIPMMSSSETDTSTSDDEPSESSTNYNILDDTYSLADPSSPDERKFGPKNRRAVNSPKFTDIPGKIVEKSLESSEEIKIEAATEENRSFDSVGNVNLESSTSYNILDDTYSLVNPSSSDETKFEPKIWRASNSLKFTDIPEKIVEKSLESSEEIKLEAATEENRSFGSVGNVNLESRTDYNNLEDNSFVEPEVIDDVKLERNFQRSVEVAKFCGISDKIDFSKILETMEETNVEPADEINLLVGSRTDRDIESSVNYDILDDDTCSLDRSSNYGKFQFDLQPSKFPEISAKTEGISAKLKESKVDPVNEGDRSHTLQSDENFESSTDYHILEEIYLPFDRDSVSHDKEDSNFRRTIDLPILSKISSTRPSIIAVTLKKVEKNLEYSEEANIEPINVGNLLSNSQSDKNLKTKVDHEILEDCPLIDRSSSEDESEDIEAKFQRNLQVSKCNISSTSALILSPPIKYIDDPSGNSKFVEIQPKSEKNLSSILKANQNLKSSFDSEIFYFDRLPIDRAIDNENHDLSYERPLEVPTVSDFSNASALILSSKSLGKIEEPSENKDQVKIEQTREGNSTSIMLRDCHSTSSTNYNFLDESYSPIEASSLDDEKFEPKSRQAIEDTKSPEIQSKSTLNSSPVKLEKVLEIRIEEMKMKSEVKENLSSNSQSNEKLESSTDYNILDDSYSLIDPISLDDGTSDSSLQQAIEFMKLPEIPNTSRSSLTSLERIERSLEKSEDVVIERPFEENISHPHFLATPPVSPNREENMFDYPASRSPSPNTKLKHLKFLPKQKRFDSTEDVGFVTSTPVETDVAMFPDFEIKEKPSPGESFESTKLDLKSTIFSSIAERKSDTNFSKFEVADKQFEKKSSIVEKLPERVERQVCPLGITFDKVTIANEIKTGAGSNPVRNNQSQTLDLGPSPTTKSPQKDSETSDPKTSTAKKEKPQKKIERTDTVIYKGPAKDRFVVPSSNRSTAKTTKSINQQLNKPTISPIPIVVAPPPEEHATRLQVPVIQTTNINVQSTFSPDEMKTQHFGSIGSRKFPIDECAISEKFSRKYRQHCMLDLIKTIDAKMMIHHMHHERRDSTKSKRKKRDRMNASATPSPDSIHRTRPHKRRSRSRSPDRTPHVHNKNQVSSLSTHSFPNAGTSLVKNPSASLPQDSPSCESSHENLSRSNINPPIVVCPMEPVLLKENTISPVNGSHLNDQLKNHKAPIIELVADNVQAEVLSCDDSGKIELEGTTLGEVVNSMNLLGPKDVDHPVFKSHSAGSLERLRERFTVTTKTTNKPNTIDDLCVPCSPIILRQPDEQQPSSPVQATSALPSSLGSKVAANSSAATKTNTAIPNMHRRSSDSDLSITPKGNSLAGSDRSMGGHLRPSTAIVRTMNQDTMEMLEYPFITMQQYPAGFVLNIGGLVSARSVKLLERITNLEEPEGRDAWWTEIRMEVRSHARALACNVVLGYKEEISICDDVCVLNASGTAAVINLLNASQDQENNVLLSRTIMTTSVESERDKSQVKSSNLKSDKSEESSVPGQTSHPAGKVKRTSESNDHEIPYLPTLSACSLCHLPYSEASVPFRVDVSKCAICRRAKVPDVLFTTIELPENIPMTGRGVFLQATVCKCKRDLRGELNAKEISDCLPFLEYELHSLLLNKLKVKGMNAIFGLKVQVSVGERLVIGMAVGTAVYLTALPTPSVPKIASGNAWHNEEQLAEIQKTLIETVKKNREFYRLKPVAEMENGRSITTSDTDESDDDLPDLDLGIGTKDACVLEVDDVEDMDRINLLMDERPPDDFHVVNTQTIPGLEDLEIVRNLQMFTQISRAKIPAGQFASMPSKYFARMIQTVLFKLRRMVPCALCDMQFKVALPEQDEIQLSVVGMALGLGEPTRFSKYKRKLIPNSASKDPVKRTDENDMIFSLDEDQADNPTAQEPLINQSTTNTSNSSPLTGLSAQKHRPRSPFRTRSHMQHRHKHVPLKERYGVDITPLSYLPGGKIERYLGNLNFFFIRESTSIRENGGLSGFTHSFVTEILAIVRAHITALGGNAMVAFFMTQCVLLHSPHKNQGQSLINVGGDVVTVSYYGDDKYQASQNC